MKINTISPHDNKYLQIVGDIANVPEKFYYIGKLPEARVPSVAIVGTRKPTAYGREVTYQLAYELAKQGIIIISGLAQGIDGIAHRACLDAKGTTIAVLACGVDIIYPSSHQGLARNIIDSGGAIISEYPIGTQARDYQFLQRNRIVSGLADAIIVTEAAIHSGTTSTVTHALEQGRDIFVVPGNITSPLSAGCNNYIKQGAHLITRAEDVIEIIAPSIKLTQNLLPLGNNANETSIIKLIQSGIRDGDELQSKSNISISEFSQTMTILEISGTIRALGGNQWVLR